MKRELKVDVSIKVTKGGSPLQESHEKRIESLVVEYSIGDSVERIS